MRLINSHALEFTVINFEFLDNYKLLIYFNNYSKKIFDFKPLLNLKIYKKLNNPAIFKQAKISCGTIVWSDEIDISPEYLFENGIDIN